MSSSIASLRVIAASWLFVSSLGQGVAAESAAKPSGSATFGIMSDYVYRGISQTGERPTGIMILDAKYGPAYFNGVLVGADLGEDALNRSIGNLEADATIGLAPSLGVVDLNLGAKYTGYPNGRDIVVGTLDHRERDFIEFFAGAKLNLGQTASIGGTAYWTPDFYYETGAVRTLEIQGALNLPALGDLQSRLTGSAGNVRSEQANVASPGHGYNYFNAGIEGQLDKIVFDLRYWTTDVDQLDVFDQRLVVSLGVKLP